MKQVYKRCSGAFASISIIGNNGLLAFRDPYGIRPLIFGKRTTTKGVQFAVASESVALDVLGFTIIRDVLPGEVIFFPKGKDTYYSQVCAEKTEYRPCLFEHVYLARPDSIIDKVSVHKARLRMGAFLAEKILKQIKKEDIDVIIPIPDSGRTAALELSEKLGVKYREGFIKNRYIGRTFIMPEQSQRAESVRRKLNAIASEFEGKNVLLVDDSIVRGTTSKQIIDMAREAGAKKVYMASAAPAVKYPNVYGIDMPASNEFAADGRTEKEISDLIGADKLIYQDLPDLIKSVKDSGSIVKDFDSSCFNGKYVTKDVTEEYLKKLDDLRNDAAKNKNPEDSDDDVMVY